MTTRTPIAIAVLAAATVLACQAKKDTANPDQVTACTEEAKVCEDGTTVSREGPDCEFPACPGEEAPDEMAADGGDEPDADEEPADEADADEESADEEAAEDAE